MAARKLARRAERERSGRFLVEGPLGVREALRAGAVQMLFVDHEAEPAWIVLEAGAAEVVRVARPVIEALAGTVTPQSVVAVAEAPDHHLAETARTASLVVVLAAVRDPGNAGTLLRSAVAAGAEAVVFSEGSVDPLNPKTVRASAGLMFHVPVVREAALGPALTTLRDNGLVVVGADAAAATSCYEADLTRRIALVLGNEAWGLAGDESMALDEAVRIPMPGPADSLNVGIAGSILLFEAARQRRAGGP